MCRRVLAVFAFLIFRSVTSFPQDVKISGGFSTDSIRLGENVAYHLTVRYPRKLKILLPDSTYNFGVFEFARRDWFPTRVVQSDLFDSVIYYFTTFELDSVLHFRLPVYVIQGSDCVDYFTPPDSLFLKQVITQSPDTLKLKANTAYLKVRKAFNYPVWLIASATGVSLIILVIIFFGKRISKRFRIYLMQRRHRKFVGKFYSRLGRLTDGADSDLEHVLHDWKKYMESLEKEPYTKLTTRELIGLHNDTVLINNLKAIDRFIYGNIKDRPMLEHFAKLLDYSINRFQVKLKEVQDGH